MCEFILKEIGEGRADLSLRDDRPYCAAFWTGYGQFVHSSVG